MSLQIQLYGSYPLYGNEIQWTKSLLLSVFRVIPYMGMKSYNPLGLPFFLLSYPLYGNEIRPITTIKLSRATELSLIWEWNFLTVKKKHYVIELSLIWEWNYTLYSSKRSFFELSLIWEWNFINLAIRKQHCKLSLIWEWNYLSMNRWNRNSETVIPYMGMKL